MSYELGNMHVYIYMSIGWHISGLVDVYLVHVILSQVEYTGLQLDLYLSILWFQDSKLLEFNS